MAMTLQQLTDLEEIRMLKYRYFRGIDTADMALLEGLFTDDIAVDYRGGAYRVTFSGKAEMMTFLANSFHSGALAMHHGHSPEIILTGDNSAEGVWYLEDIFIDLERGDHTFGSAIYRDRYRREGGQWKVARTEYDRVIEVVQPIRPDTRITEHMLAKTGLKPAERTDITHLIQWDEVA